MAGIRVSLKEGARKNCYEVERFAKDEMVSTRQRNSLQDT